MEFLNQLFVQYSAFTHSSPIIAGAVSLWGLGVLTFMCRKVPSVIWEVIVNQFTTTLTFNNTQYGYARSNFVSFLKWFQKHQWAKMSRSFALEASGWNYDGSDKAMELGIGNGRHFFFYQRRLFIVRRTSESKAGAENNIYTIELRMVGRKHEIMHQLIDEFSYKFEKGSTGIYCFRRGWELYSGVKLRALNTVVVNR